MQFRGGLSPLLDGPAIFSFATHVIALRKKLSAKYRHALPAVEDLAVAFNAYIQQRDLQRLQSPIVTLHPDSSAFAPHQDDLVRFLAIADAAYSTDEYTLSCNINRLGKELENFEPSPPILFQAQSQKWFPAHYVIYDECSQTLILAIRGSYQTADCITNLSLDTVPFLDGRAHKGIAQSAQTLHDILRPQLAKELEKRKPPGGLIVTGHSLGAGVGAALVLLLRRGPCPTGETIAAWQYFRRAKCYSYGPPPFLNASLAATTRQHSGILTIINGFDFVPRLSIRSVDRLLDRMATFDYSPIFTDYTRRATASLAGLFVHEADAHAIALQVSQVAENTDARLVASVPRIISNVAQSATQQGQAGHSFWTVLAHATHFLTAIVADKMEHHVDRVQLVRNEQQKKRMRQARQQQSEKLHESFDNFHENKSDDEDSNDEEDIDLVGEIWHLDRKFSAPVMKKDEPILLPPSMLIKRDSLFFKDIDLCTWMKYDHFSSNMISALRSLRNSQSVIDPYPDG